jgi:hypothetical protein
MNIDLTINTENTDLRIPDGKLARAVTGLQRDIEPALLFQHSSRFSLQCEEGYIPEEGYIS